MSKVGFLLMASVSSIFAIVGRLVLNVKDRQSDQSLSKMFFTHNTFTTNRVSFFFAKIKMRCNFIKNREKTLILIPYRNFY